MTRPADNFLCTVIVLAGLCISPVSVAAADRTPEPAPAAPIAELRELLGRGKYAEAEQGARDALAQLQSSGDGESLAAAELLDVLVAAMPRGGKATHADAAEFAGMAIAIKEKRLGRSHPEVGKSLDNAGVLYFIRGDYQRAQALYERSLQIFATAAAADPQHKTGLGKVHSHLGPLFQELGRYSTARQHYEESLRLLLETLGSENSQVAMARNNLATLMSHIGDHEEALRLYRESQASLEKQLGNTHPLIATGKHNLAELHQKMDRSAEAAALYQESIALKEKSLGPAHPSLALTLANLSHLRSDLGEPDAAVTLARRSVEIQKAALGESHVDLAYGLVGLGRAQAGQGDYAAARASLSRALALRTESLGPENPLLVPPLHFLSAALAGAGMPREAFDAALRAESIGREHLRLTARGAPERQALRYAKERLSSLDIALSIAMDARDPSLSQDAWDALIRSRAVVLDEMAARHRLAARQGDRAVQAAFETYRTRAESLSNLLLRGPGTGGIDRYRNALDELRSAKEAAERELASRSEIVRREFAQQSIGYEQVRAALPGNATLVAFARVEPRRDAASPGSAYAAFILDATRTPRLVSLGPARDIETAIRRWRDEIIARKDSAGIRTDRRAAGRLRELLWDPLGIDTRGDRLVLIVPDGAIHLVNFAALPTADGRYLAEADLLLHYLSSERDVGIGPEKVRQQQLLVAGGVEMGATMVSATRAAPVADDCTLRQQDFPLLPASLSEAQRVMKIWRSAAIPSGSPVTELLEASATEAAFKQHARGKSLVHVATHGFFMPGHCATNPLTSPLRLSGLVFAAGSAAKGGRSEDGILLAEEVATLDFSQARWVVLSGCDTGIGEIQTDEGILGLRRAFRIAGAGTLVVSLWPVEDVSAETFMTSLYRARLGGRRTTADSMRQAYRDALATARRTHADAHPLYWAPFIASGDWR